MSNNVTTVSRKPPPVAQSSSPDVSALMRRYLAPECKVAEIIAASSAISQAEHELIHRQARDAATAITSTYTPHRIGAWRDTVIAASRPATRPVTMTLLLMVQDAFKARADERTEIAASATLYLLESVTDGSLPSPYLLARAVDAALRESKFAPAPSEVLHFVELAEGRLAKARSTVEKASELSRQAGEIISGRKAEWISPEEWHIWRPRQSVVEEAKTDRIRSLLDIWDQPARQIAGRVFVKHGTREWRAWYDYWLKTQGRPPPSDTTVNGCGWYFPSAMPPSALAESE